MAGIAFPVVDQSRNGPGTTAQHALDGLRRAIVSGRLRPGQRVVQEDLADELGVSVAPVREALRALEQEGQVGYRPRRGYFVTELTAADLEEIYELRLLLEDRAARRAHPRLADGPAEEAAAAARACAEAVDAGDLPGILAANRRFHFALLEPSGQARALRLIQLLWDSTEAYRAIYYASPAERHATLTAHERILDAARDGDADAFVAQLAAHRTRVLRRLTGLLGPGGS